MCCGGSPLSKLGVTAGLLSFISIVAAVVTGSWLYTKEPLFLPGSKTKSSVTFKIGLWRVCPVLKRVLTTPYTLLQVPGCQVITYSSWVEVKEADLGITWSSLEFTPAFITKMRYATPLVALSATMLGLATLLAVRGHSHNDFRTLVACGLYTIGGLVLAAGLVVFVSVLNDVTSFHPEFYHRYGRSFHAATASCVLSQAAAILSITAFLRRFPSGEAMVRAVVPGADRELAKQRVHTVPNMRVEKPLRNTRDLFVIRSVSSDRRCKSPATVPPRRYSTMIHQGLSGMVNDYSSSDSSPSSSGRFSQRIPEAKSFNSLPRPQKFPRIENHFESIKFPRRNYDPSIDSPSSGSLNI